MTKTKKISKHKCKIEIGGHDIAWKNQLKYLGIVLHSRLAFGMHIKKKTQQAQGIRNILHPLLKANNMLASHLKLILYKILIRLIQARSTSLEQYEKKQLEIHTTDAEQDTPTHTKYEMKPGCSTQLPHTTATQHSRHNPVWEFAVKFMSCLFDKNRNNNYNTIYNLRRYTKNRYLISYYLTIHIGEEVV